MAGDPLNASLWGDADVFVGALDAPNPATIDDPFGAGWGLCGLLDGEAGFGHSREEQETDLYAWGGILVRTSRRQFKMSRSFTLLEDNEVTRDLVWPGSSATELFVPRIQRVKLGFELREGAVKERTITSLAAEVKVDADITDNEVDLTKFPMRAVIFPDPNQISEITGAPKLFDRQKTAVSSS